ncbi:KdsC family phosphatase [Wenzhouxiangella marina]|uniref:3-deoxy-D-manno-octulosonate 8-phosphate phosphatase KdsC n=1 Tax=Wenzhouxiangella marina TaxID=1579979 RepID=A0A0K0XTN3_9GAMM|nr:hypothetical protein [Wenzhouxiangella marina]AKS41020.1 3-deoxy-D-manno-octulosonate 8-phosphate phosphatase [Wenzhouxiangella marina]MBB6087898.1 3-deoxy-D-manno-octulosonate 8-phosphate phosphatase (KDO 8-P phosphatase) [Wenzhouxiangella marina]
MSLTWSETLLERAAEVRLAVFDVDGVMTDGRITYASDGSELKSFHSRDGLGLKALMRHGIEVAVITARQSNLVERRMAELGIERVLQGRNDKSSALDELMLACGVGLEQTAYAGDDLVDWPAMRRCGLKCVPADAAAFLRERADHVCSLPGGRGAVREICELILAGHGRLESWQESFV